MPPELRQLSSRGAQLMTRNQSLSVMNMGLRWSFPGCGILGTKANFRFILSEKYDKIKISLFEATP
jgi:hypothetical protein